jgi:hypothetical protein
MGNAIGQILPLAMGVALSPVAIVAVVLMLGTPGATANGPAFLLGWIAGLAVIGAVVLLVAGGADASTNGSPAGWVGWLKIVLGLLLLAVAVKQWQSRPHAGARPSLPRWMQTIDRFTPGRSVAVGVALSAINPKNLLLVVGAAAAIAQTGIPGGQQAVALGVFVVIATLGPGIPVGLYFTMRDRSEHLLLDLRDWMAANNATIMAVLCLLIAAKLVGDGISALAG